MSPYASFWTTEGECHNRIMIKIRAMMARIFSYSGRHAKISLEFTDKVPFFVDLSVSKTHFTDKPASSNDLSVNFWPLWWRFTDKAGFLEHLSVKPGPKRLNFYGQTAIFDHFVRKRHFSIEPFTDSMPIFIDVSVNNRDFAKCSAAQHLLNQCTWLRLRAPSFGVGGRTFFQFWGILFCFRGRAGRIWSRR